MRPSRGALSGAATPRLGEALNPGVLPPRRLFCQSYQDRRSRARKMRKDTLHAIENSFNAYLHQRGYTGSILMKWEEHRLELKVRRRP